MAAGMAKARTNPVDEQLAKLEAIKNAPATPEGIVELTRAIGGKSNVVAAKGAGSLLALALRRSRGH